MRQGIAWMLGYLTGEKGLSGCLVMRGSSTWVPLGFLKRVGEKGAEGGPRGQGGGVSSLPRGCCNPRDCIFPLKGAAVWGTTLHLVPA